MNSYYIRRIGIVVGLAFALTVAPAIAGNFWDDPDPAHKRNLLEDKIHQAELDAIDFIKDQKNFDKKHDAALSEAIRFLGTIRSTDAIPSLVENLEFVGTRSMDDYDEEVGLTEESIYPAMSALENIGCEAVPELLIAITSKDRVDSKGSGVILRQVT